MFNIELGKFLADLRLKNDLTQEQLARKLNIDKRKISRWECGNSPPEFEILVQLQDIFHVSLYEFSIFQEVEDKKAVEKFKLKFKKLKDYKMYTFKQKLLTIFAIIIGIILGLCAIFTIDNYGTVDVYEFVSLDKNFALSGNYIKTKNEQIFNVSQLGFLEFEDSTLTKEKLDIDVYNIEVEIKSSNDRILALKINSLNNTTIEKANLLDVVNQLTFSRDNLTTIIKENNKLTFIIKYEDISHNVQSIKFDFKLQKIFQNTL